MRYVIIAKAGSCMIILLYWMMTIFLFGPQLGSHLRFPLLELIRYVEVGQILENLDPILLSIWSATLFVKSSLLLFLAAQLLSRLFRLAEHRSVPFLLGTFVFVFAYQASQSPAEFNNFLGSAAFTTFMISVELVPLLYWMVGKIRRRL